MLLTLKPLCLNRRHSLMPLYKNSKELNIGRAGEYLVMFDLLSKGYQAFLTDQGVAYDVVLDLGSRLVRLQVKTTQKPAKMNKEYANNVYLFSVRRAGRGGARSYGTHEFDGFALVALDRKSVYYYPFNETINKTLLFRLNTETYKVCAGQVSPYIEGFTLEKFLSEIGYKEDSPDPLIPVETKPQYIQLSLIQSA